MEKQKSFEQRKQNVLGALNSLREKYPNREEKIEDIAIKFENGVLGEGEEGASLRIEGISLVIKRNQSADEVLSALEDFIDQVQGVNPGTAEAAHVHSEVKDIIQPLAEGRDKTYWRDVAASISFMKRYFKGLALSNDLMELRKLIHQKSLGNTDFEIKDGSVLLEIKKGDSEDILLSKLSRFIKAIQNRTPDMPRQAEAREGVEGNGAHLEAWAMANGALTILKKINLNNPRGELAQELRDWAHAHYTLGQSYELSLKTPQGEEVIFSPKDDNEVALKKVTRFIDALQTPESKEQIEAALTGPGKEAIAQKNKLYWRDITAGLDALQKDYPADKYEGIEDLRQMIEDNELASGSSLILDVEGAKLVVRKKDSDEVIKSKISVFIGILKQLASQKKEVQNPVYWRDILADLNAMQDVYGQEADFQLLVMSIEMGTLATARDLDISVGEYGLKLSMHDSDQRLKEKISDFVKKLKQSRSVNVSKEEISKYKRRIEAMEKETQRKQAEYEYKIEKQGDEIKRLKQDVGIVEQELQYERSKKAATPPSYQPSYSRSFSG